MIALVLIACSFIFGPLRQQSMGFRLVLPYSRVLGFSIYKTSWDARLVYAPSSAWFVLLPI